MSGYSFAAIYKAPVPPGPGPVNPDVPIDDPDDPDNINYTISGTSIKPFVPFTVTVTGSSNKAKGNGGNLQADIDYEILNDAGWQSGQRVFSLGTRVCDSERSNAQFSWLIRGRTPSTVTLAYDAGTMTPDLEKDNLTIGESFGFTITYSAHENCYASHLADFGASYWWEAQKNGAWERTTRIATNTSSFAEGVLTGNATVGNLAGYDKIRLCVSYAGRETAYAEATLVASEVTITLGDSGLHCFGPYTSLQIESDSLELMTAAFYRGNNTTDDITDTNGTPIAFTFSGTTWTGNIQADTSAASGTVVLKVMFRGEVVASEEIFIATDLLGSTIDAPAAIMQGESIEATGEISNEDYPDISRIPANTVKLVIDSGATAHNEAGEDSVSLTYVPTSSGTYTLSLIDERDDTVLDTCEVEVKSVYDALKEAIEERYRAKGSNTTVESVAMDILATHAINAMSGYIKGSIGSDGAFSEGTYNSNNTGITTSDYEGTENEWALDTYHKICAAVSREAVTSSMYYSEYWKKTRKTVTVQGNLTKDGNDDVIGVEDLSSLISRALTAWSEASWSEDYDNGDMKCKKEMIVSAPSYTNKNNYNRGSVKVEVELWYQQRPYKYNVAGVIDFYMSATPYVSGGNYDNCGHRVPASASVKQKTYSLSVSAGTDILTEKLAGGTLDEMTNIYNGSYQTIYGYNVNSTTAIITFNFKHK